MSCTTARGSRHATVVAYLALFVALGGTSVAALKITGRDVRDSSLTGRDIHNRSLTGTDVRDHSLTARDLRLGALPAGPPGPKGDAGTKGDPGAQGDPGAAGAPGVSAGYAERMEPGTVIEDSPTTYGTILVQIDAPSADYVLQGSVALKNTGGSQATVVCFLTEVLSGPAGSGRVPNEDETSVTLAPGERETVPLAAAGGFVRPVLMCRGQNGPGAPSGPSPIQPDAAKLTAIEVSETP